MRQTLSVTLMIWFTHVLTTSIWPLQTVYSSIQNHTLRLVLWPKVCLQHAIQGGTAKEETIKQKKEKTGQYSNTDSNEPWRSLLSTTAEGIAQACISRATTKPIGPIGRGQREGMGERVKRPRFFTKVSLGFCKCLLATSSSFISRLQYTSSSGPLYGLSVRLTTLQGINKIK